MAAENPNQTSSLDKVKAWLAPLLILGMSTIIWTTMLDMQKDIKELLASNNYQKAKFEELEKKMDRVEKKVFVQHLPAPNTMPFKHEDFYVVNESD
jgi:hypothetical protein